MRSSHQVCVLDPLFVPLHDVAARFKFQVLPSPLVTPPQKPGAMAELQDCMFFNRRRAMESDEADRGATDLRFEYDS